MGWLMGIDLGTSGVKVIAAAPDGTVMGFARREYPIQIPQTGWAEQDPETWWSCTKACIREVTSFLGGRAKDIAAVGFSGQMHGTVTLDKDCKPLRPAILWCDRRCGAEAAAVNRRVGKAWLAGHTFNAASAGFMLPTLLWLRKNEPLYDRIFRVMLPKDYIRYKLTGEIASDVTDASATGAFDAVQRTWSVPLLEKLGLDRAIFPPLGEPWAVAGQITRQAFAETGLPEGIPAVYGGGDQPMHALGSGLTGPGVISVNLGTGGQVCATADSPVYDKKLRTHTFVSAVPDCWNIFGAVLSAGLSLTWLADNILSQRDFSRLDRDAAQAEPGSGGLLFAPYVSGVRTPHMDANARGVFLGLSLEHDRRHLTRAVMEGVAFALRETLDIFAELPIPCQTLLACGGGAKSELWLSILANVFAMPLQTVAAAEQACLGAAIAAGVGAGVYASVREGCRAAVRIRPEVIRPDKHLIDLYAHNYAAYKRIYAANKSIFHALTARP